MAEQDKYSKLCKEKMAEELASRLKDHPDFVITSYMGSTVADLELLRRNLHKSSSSYFVVKNSILKIVFDRLKLEAESSTIDSGMGISLSGDDIISTCRVLTAFAKDHDKFKIKGAIVDGKSVTPEKVRELASLPSRNILLAQVVGGVKAPITGFVNTLGGILRKFIYVIGAIKTSRESSPPAAQG